MELAHIEAFLKIVEKGSFSGAAEALYLTQPTISVRIQQLEKELNTSLFVRNSGKSVTLTPSAQKLLPFFEEGYQLIQKGAEMLRNPFDKIRISCPNHMGSEILPELLKLLYNHFPEIDFPVYIQENEMVINDLLEKKSDIGFAYLEDTGSLKNINIIEISNLHNIAVCSPEHPLSKKEKISIENLKNERIIVFNKQFFLSKVVEQFLKQHGLTDYQTTEVENLGWIKMMVRKGLGIAFLQKSIVNEELKNGKLIELSLTYSLPPSSIYLLIQPIIPEEISTLVTQTADTLFDTLRS